MIRANIDACRQIWDHSIPFKTKVTLSSASSAAQMSGVNDDCYIHYYIQVKSSHLYLYSAFNNTNCVKATAQYQNGKIVSIM